MVAEQLAGRGIRDERVLRAMEKVPRHRFVHESLEMSASDDRPLPIGFGQTISQPFMVARATELAAPREGDRVLEVGAGCGYQAAILAELAAKVFAIEVHPELARHALLTLDALGYKNVIIDAFDGSGGWPRHAPYDVIIVSAGAPRIPALLLAQLREGGRLVIPLGEGVNQVLTCVHFVNGAYDTIRDTSCRYVDLVGRYGVGTTPPQS
jgi:protein-L-isoaspartate(D-aspartate) O-methyltransferase